MNLLLLATNTVPWLLLQKVRLHFLLFELEQCTKCVCDSLDIAMVGETTTPMTYSFCGSIIPDDVSTSTNTVSVYFRTDGSTTATGFRIYYSDILPVQGIETWHFISITTKIYLRCQHDFKRRITKLIIPLMESGKYGSDIQSSVQINPQLELR